MDKFFGKYQGTVTINEDPQKRGRLQVMVPGVLNYVPSTWAEPCVPYAGPIGPPMGLYMIPPPGTGVWVEFEKGDINFPIWTGCRWGLPSNIPPLAHIGIPANPNIVLQSFGQHAIVISDVPGTPATGGIMLKSFTGASIIVNDSGIYIQNGKGASITLQGPSVDINIGALTII